MHIRQKHGNINDVAALQQRMEGISPSVSWLVSSKRLSPFVVVVHGYSDSAAMLQMVQTEQAGAIQSPGCGRVSVTKLTALEI